MARRDADFQPYRSGPTAGHFRMVCVSEYVSLFVCVVTFITM